MAALSAFLVLSARGEPRLIHVANDRLELALDSTNGSLVELTDRSNNFNQLAEPDLAAPLWKISINSNGKSQQLSPGQIGAPTIEKTTENSLHITWNNITNISGPLRIDVFVAFDQQNPSLSRWNLSVAKPETTRIERIEFPCIGALRKRADECLAVPKQLGLLAHDPRALIERSGRRITWHSPHGTDLSIPCLAFYQVNGPGFYGACDDPQGFIKELILWSDASNHLNFGAAYQPEQFALGQPKFDLPFTVVLGTFHGDWTTAAEIYRESPTSKNFAAQGMRRQQLAPSWINDTGLWLWNRGRSSEVLVPAVALRKYIDAPVSILWHWWHNCAYDAGFPEFLPPREGTESFKTALSAAQQKDIHAILYMNQRLWGTNTESWRSENAEVAAVKNIEGKVVTESYNKFTNAPCAPMCNSTQFWRDKYAGLARSVLCDLKADGIYMDQAGVLASCYDTNHDHILGPGRYWANGFDTLTAEIRNRASTRGPVALGSEFAGEPWLGDFDLNLGLCVSHDRIGGSHDWEPIPFFAAVYHSSSTIFGNLSGLAYPPYDEKWPQQLAPTNAMTLLDSKFSQQFYLDQARTFVWGMQPMLANFLPAQMEERRNELDYVKRLVQTRHRALKYLAHGTWLRPPALGVPDEEIDVCSLGVYSPLKASRRKYPVAIAGAWRASDGNVAIALASISDKTLAVQLPIDVRYYGLPDKSRTYRIDQKGRHRIGTVTKNNPSIKLQLSPRALLLLELTR